MGGFFHTGVGNGTARTTYAAIGQVQDGSVVYAAASGTDTYTATLAPAITAYATGMKLRIKIANANATTTPTLNVNSVGAKTIKYQGGSALAVGALAANGFYDLVYDGTDLILTNPATQPATTFGSTVTMTGAAINEAQGADIASATTTSIGAATGNSVTVTGTTTITGLGTVQAGTRRVVTFSGALTLTHNATSLILPGGVSITTVAGDKATFISLGSGNWFCLEYTRIDGRPVNQIKGTTIASATTTDIGAANGEYIDVSGTVTITGLGTIAAGVQRIVTFTGALILTHNATSLILPGGANITTAAGDSAFFVSLGSGNWKCLAFAPILGPAVRQSPLVTTSILATTGTTPAIPYDDTIPQSTEGTLILSRAITPKSTASRLVITVSVSVSFTSASSNDALALALFQDATADAIAVDYWLPVTTAVGQQRMTFRHEMAAGTTSSTTFKVHIGSHSATAWMINGSTAGAASGRKGGGISYSTIDIVEYAP